MKNNISSGYRCNLLTVIEFDSVDKFHNRIFKCKCDCGNFCYVKYHRLNSKKTISCGCSKIKRHSLISADFWSSIKSNAKKRNIEFNLTEQDIVDQYLKQNKKCALTGLDVVFGKETKKGKQTASVDRLDSTKPYTKDNIQIVHKDINFSKWVFSQQKFIELCKAVRDFNLMDKQ